ncbi:MAG: hypothetical protein WA432_00030 [Candidatus Babeliaceae bacterium]
MEVLNILEQKIASLIESKKQDLETIKELKTEIRQLQEETSRSQAEISHLKEENSKLADSLLAYNQNIEQQDASLQKVKLALEEQVEDIINSISLLVEQPQQ